MLSLSQEAKFGRNYIQQMIKNGKEPGADHLAKLLDLLGPRAALYVFTGLDLEEDDRQFLAALSGMDAETKRDALRLFQRIGSGEGRQAPQPSDRSRSAPTSMPT